MWGADGGVESKYPVIGIVVFGVSGCRRTLTL